MNDSNDPRGHARTERAATIVGVALVCLLPWIAWVVGVRASAATENRPLADAPRVDPAALVDEDFYAALDRFLVDHLPLRQEAAGTLNAGLYGLVGESPVDDAFVRRDGTWILAEDFLLACAGDFDVDRLADTFRTWEAASGGAVEVRLVVAPDKSAVASGAPTPRTRAGDNCQVQREAGLRAAFGESPALLDVWTPLRQAAESAADGTGDRLYFRYDSHWTFRGATEMAAVLVESFGVPFEREHLVDFGEASLVGDVTRRLALERVETLPLRESHRPGIARTMDVEQFAAVEGLRTHRSTSSSAGRPLVPGRTVVLHDSMMAYAEAQIAPYFEHIEFVHWNDLEPGGFFDRVADADRVVLQVVQRDLYERTRSQFNEPGFRDRMIAALTR